MEGNPSQGSGGPQGQGGGGKRRRRRRRGGGGGGQNQNREGGQPQAEGGAEGRPPEQAREGGRPPREARDGGRPPREGGGRPPGQQQQGKDGSRRDKGRDKGRGRGRDREERDRDRGPPMDPRLKNYEKYVPKNEPAFKHVKHRYGLVVFDKLEQAKADLENLKAKAQEFDQLNIVIRAEGGMDDPELNAIGNVKVFAGTAWALIHDRRKEEGWYDEAR